MMPNSLLQCFSFRSGVAIVLASQMVISPAGITAQMADQPNPQMVEPDQGHGAARMLAAKPTAKPGTPLTQDERILHVLNRLTYGPRPGDFEWVKAMGLQAWIVQQMSPQKIDDSALDARLAEFPAMSLSLAQLMATFPTKAMVKQEAQGKINPMATGSEAERAIYADEMERQKNKKKNKPDDQNAAAEPAMEAGKAQAILALPPDKRFSALCKMTLPEIHALRQGLRGEDRERLTDGFTPQQFEALAAFQSPGSVVATETLDTKLLRDIYSERQLDEVMVDFWLNHFNVYIKKSKQAPYYIAAYEKSSIRPYALGKFEDLLRATAMSPAMLNYLDNSSSVGPHSVFAGRPQGPKGKRPSGLNENYARELMELHTLGVGGGYTQHDVTEVAKVFTGWTVGPKSNPLGGRVNRQGVMESRDVDEPVQPGFDAAKHEPGPKVVLGVTIKENGSNEGLQVLHMLATSPATAKFISRKLAVRFVSDDPPQALVDRMADKFLSSQGDIRSVLATMIDSPEFWSRDAYRAKVKTPQDFVVSALRASGAEVASPAALVGQIAELGMPIYGMQTPNGYSMKADPWNNTGALVSRMNFALALSANKVPGVTVNWSALLGQDGQAMTPATKDAMLEDKLLHERVSERTRQTILTQISVDADQQEASLRQISVKGPKRDPLVARMRQPDKVETDNQSALAAGLLFGSPEFQRR